MRLFELFNVVMLREILYLIEKKIKFLCHLNLLYIIIIITGVSKVLGAK